MGAPSPSPSSQRQILWIAVGLGSSWLLVQAALLKGAIRHEQVAAYFLGHRPQGEDGNPVTPPLGLMVLQLFLYPFLHWNIAHLVSDLLWLTALVWVCRQFLDVEAFIRIASLGVFGGGLIYAVVCQAMQTPGQLSGGALLFAALLGSLATYYPEVQVHLFGKDFPRVLMPHRQSCLLALFIVFISTWFLPNKYRALIPENWSPVLVNLQNLSVELVVLLIAALRRLSYAGLVVAWLAPFLIEWGLSWLLYRSLPAFAFVFALLFSAALGLLYTLFSTPWE
jgi:hypothetical protein